MSMPVIVVFSVLTAIGYWRQVSPVSEAAKSLVDIRTVEPGTIPPPPMLPSSVPSHTKCLVDQAAKAAKITQLGRGLCTMQGRPKLPLRPTHSPSQLLRSTLNLVHAQDEETEVTSSVEYIDSEATTEEVDLFNNQGRIVITNIPNGMWEERGRVNLHAHNPNPHAPEHLSMVNNLTNDNAKKKIVHDGTNLTCISQPEWKNLRSRVIMLAEPMTHCCFQCGMLNHPEKNDTIIVDDIQGKHDCRAYRVLRSSSLSSQR